MFHLGASVYVRENGKILGTGKAIAVCQTIQELNRYFDKKHPLYTKYRLNLLNDEIVYIVQFENDGGIGGYLSNQLNNSQKWT